MKLKLAPEPAKDMKSDIWRDLNESMNRSLQLNDLILKAVLSEDTKLVAVLLDCAERQTARTSKLIAELQEKDS